MGPGSILEIEPVGFPDRLDVVYEGKRVVKGESKAFGLRDSPAETGEAVDIKGFGGWEIRNPLWFMLDWRCQGGIWIFNPGSGESSGLER